MPWRADLNAESSFRAGDPRRRHRREPPFPSLRSGAGLPGPGPSAPPSSFGGGLCGRRALFLPSSTVTPRPESVVCPPCVDDRDLLGPLDGQPIDVAPLEEAAPAGWCASRGGVRCRTGRGPNQQRARAPARRRSASEGRLGSGVLVHGKLLVPGRVAERQLADVTTPIDDRARKGLGLPNSWTGTGKADRRKERAFDRGAVLQGQTKPQVRASPFSPRATRPPRDEHVRLSSRQAPHEAPRPRAVSRHCARHIAGGSRARVRRRRPRSGRSGRPDHADER